MPKHRLVLLGGGFAGTWMATHALPAHANLFEVTLVSEEPLFTFSPLLINGLAGDLSSEQFTLDLTKLAAERGFRFVQGKIGLVDRAAKIVHVQTLQGTPIELAYDSAVLATGAQANFFGIPGLQEESFALKQLSDVDRLIAHLSERLTAASKVWTDEDKIRLLSFVIVGGGPSGVEILGAMRERLETLAYQQGVEQVLPFIKITLIEANKVLFTGFPEELSKKSEEALRQGGVDVRCNIQVIGAKNGLLTFADNTTLAYGTVVWAAGVKATPPPIEPAFPSGPLKPDEFLRLGDHLYGAGDTVVYEKSGVKFPKTAQFALQMAEGVLKNIIREAKGEAPVLPRLSHPAALITVLQTGFFSIGSRVLNGHWVHPFRKLLYRLRLWQIRTGH